MLRRIENLQQFSTDYAAFLIALARPSAFPFPLPNDCAIPVIQTHASAVLLTPDLVYKLKKPKNYGFFDYSTPALRRHFCAEEVRLNARLASQVYIGVAPVLALPDQTFRFGPTLATNTLPEPGAAFDGGEVVDYAVVMVRLPDEAMLESRVWSDTVSLSALVEVAQYLAAFHAATPSNQHIASFGTLEVIRRNWEENFEQMRPYIDRTLDEATYNRLAAFVRSSMEQRMALFSDRVRQGYIRDCHGDLRLQHVYLFDESPTPTRRLPRLAILDCIEFNERFRYSDVAAEVAFLAMELDNVGRADLSQAFVDGYIAATGDEALRELLPFYQCYRACVRGKVTSFQLDSAEVSDHQREVAQREAAELFRLAASYAEGPTGPTLLMIGGLMGTGKTTLAQTLQRVTSWSLFSSDTTRKRLAHLEPSRPQAESFGQGLYSHEWTARTYQALRQEASLMLAHGRSVLIDASFSRRADRDAITREAVALGANVVFVECLCPRDVALERLTRRWQTYLEGEQLTASTAPSASDGRPELYDQQRNLWEAFNSEQEQHIQHLVITTTLPLMVNIEQILDALRLPRLMCPV